jgi:hypothetical protein
MVKYPTYYLKNFSTPVGYMPEASYVFRMDRQWLT